MFIRIGETIKKSFQQETLAERSRRMVPGAVYGIFATTVFVLVSSVINTFFFPDLHMGVDWVGFLIHWMEYGLAMAGAGIIVGWFTEEYMGIVGGGVVLTIFLLVGNLVANLMGGGNSALTVQSLITAIPLVGVCILLAFAIRAAINRHISVRQLENVKLQRNGAFQLALIVFLVGLIPGVFSRFGVASEDALRTLNKGLQSTTTYPPLDSRFPLAMVPSLKDHIGIDYSIYARTSTEQAGSLDATIRFIDGYTITCIVPIADGDAAFLQFCNEGSRIISP